MYVLYDSFIDCVGIQNYPSALCWKFWSRFSVCTNHFPVVSNYEIQPSPLTPTPPKKNEYQLDRYWLANGISYFPTEKGL